MKLTHLALAVFVPLTLIPYQAQAQRLDEMQTESDWESLLDQGLIDYNSFQLYRELAEDATVHDTSDFIQSTLGNPLSDFIAPSGEMGGVVRQYQPNTQHFKFRSGQRIQENQNSGYVLLSSQQPLNIEYKGRNDNNSWHTERRMAHFANNEYDITLGNYTANIGSGLGIGRYDYRPIGIPKDSLRDDFLFPDNSYYNGAKIGIDNRYTVLFSSKKYLSVQKAFLGGSASLLNKSCKLGVTAGATSLKSGGNHRTLGEGSIFLTNPDLGFSAEAGYAESGAGFVFQYNRRNYDIKFWHYDDSFINLQCSGMAYPDYLSYQDEQFPVTFRQPQAGESGLSFRHDATINKLYLLALLSAWKRFPENPTSLDNTFGARLPLGDLFSFNARYSERSGYLPGRSLTDLGANFRKWFQADALVSFWHDHKGPNNTRSYAQLYISIPFKSSFSADGRIRWHFDGKLEYFVEERTVIANRLTLKATYRWQDSFGPATGPLYLIMETVY